MVYDITFPAGFDVADAVLVPPVPSADGKWYFSVYGKVNSSAPALTYLCRWGPGMAQVEFVPLDVYTHARGAPAVGIGGARLWLFGFDTGKRLIVQLTEGWAPPAWLGTDPRVDTLVSQVAVLQLQLVEVQTALGNVSGGGLTDEQAADLVWLKALRRLLSVPG